MNSIKITPTPPTDPNKPTFDELATRFDASFESSELAFRDVRKYDPRVHAMVQVELYPPLKRRFRNSSRRQVYIYRWNLMGRKGQRCIVHVRGSMNSCLIEFEDGQQAVTSRNALRKEKASGNQ